MRRAYPDVRQPPSVRDFFAFEEHVRNARAAAGRGGVPDAWYETPVFYFSNPAAIYRDGDDVPKPADTAMLDYELELAAVIGTEGGIEGFTIMNDWSARDLQGKEMSVGLGPAKGKDFATSLGPELVSPDELPAGPDLRATARVNGEVRTDTRTGAMHWSWDDLLAAAARNTPGLRAGEVIGSGTVGGGCILEHGDGRWLESGDVVELEIEGIGVLRNTVGDASS
jgi:fumarylacetoacetate (FAA) hydrolase